MREIRKMYTIKKMYGLGIIIIIIMSIFSDCIGQQIDKNETPIPIPINTNNPISSPISSPIPFPTKIKNSIPIPTKTIVEKIQLEKYDGRFFSIDKPIGWEVITAGDCETFAFVIRDRQNTENQIFMFTEFGPLYLNQQYKMNDRNYMDSGGYPVVWYDMPVIDPFTPENFLENFQLAAQTSLVRQFMLQIPVIQNVDIISSSQQQSQLGDTKIMRALFMQNGKLGEGLFYVGMGGQNTVVGFGYALLFTGISGDKDNFRSMESALLQSAGSFKIYSNDYIDRCTQKIDATGRAALETSKILSETSDIIMQSWEDRNKADDIISEKKSDERMGRDTIYDKDTGLVYEVDPNFYSNYNLHRDEYKMSNLQRLPDNNVDLWTSTKLNANNIH